MRDNELHTQAWHKLLSKGMAPAGSRAAGKSALVTNWPIGDMMPRVRR